MNEIIKLGLVIKTNPFAKNRQDKRIDLFVVDAIRHKKYLVIIKSTLAVKYIYKISPINKIPIKINITIIKRNDKLFWKIMLRSIFTCLKYKYCYTCY